MILEILTRYYFWRHGQSLVSKGYTVWLCNSFSIEKVFPCYTIKVKNKNNNNVKTRSWWIDVFLVFCSRLSSTRPWMCVWKLFNGNVHLPRRFWSLLILWSVLFKAKHTSTSRKILQFSYILFLVCYFPKYQYSSITMVNISAKRFHF